MRWLFLLRSSHFLFLSLSLSRLLARLFAIPPFYLKIPDQMILDNNK